MLNGSHVLAPLTLGQPVRWGLFPTRILQNKKKNGEKPRNTFSRGAQLINIPAGL